MGQRVAIVGAGPAGFYTAGPLLDAGFAVDLFDALPTPYGLVRLGVAPDHPKIKSVTRIYEKIAARSGFRFVGGVRLGQQLRREDLLGRYHAVVYTVGAPADRRLGIPGEDRPGCRGARDFVAWYNAHPSYADDHFQLDRRRAVVVGNGNVALDVARMLLIGPGELARTDTADHAIDALERSEVRDVVVLGRRGPAQASFTTPELRELTALSDVDVTADAAQLDRVGESADPRVAGNLATLRGYATGARRRVPRRLEFRFWRSPIEILGLGEHGPVTGVRVSVNRLRAEENGGMVLEAGGVEEVIDCGLVLRSIGYRGVPIDGLPFDAAHGIIPNADGRVTAPAGVLQGEYVAGWIKRGPSGVIGTNKKDAAETVACILEDAANGELLCPDDQRFGDDRLADWLRWITPRCVDWNGWQRIDRHETDAGARCGRPRVKLARLEDLYSVAEAAVPVSD